MSEARQFLFNIIECKRHTHIINTMNYIWPKLPKVGSILSFKTIEYVCEQNTRLTHRKFAIGAFFFQKPYTLIFFIHAQDNLLALFHLLLHVTNCCRITIPMTYTMIIAQSYLSKYKKHHEISSFWCLW